MANYQKPPITYNKVCTSQPTGPVSLNGNPVFSACATLGCIDLVSGSGMSVNTTNQFGSTKVFDGTPETFKSNYTNNIGNRSTSSFTMCGTFRPNLVSNTNYAQVIIADTSGGYGLRFGIGNWSSTQNRVGMGGNWASGDPFTDTYYIYNIPNLDKDGFYHWAARIGGGGISALIDMYINGNFIYSANLINFSGGILDPAASGAPRVTIFSVPSSGLWPSISTVSIFINSGYDTPDSSTSKLIRLSTNAYSVYSQKQVLLGIPQGLPYYTTSEYPNRKTSPPAIAKSVRNKQPQGPARVNLANTCSVGLAALGVSTSAGFWEVTQQGPYIEHYGNISPQVPTVYGLGYSLEDSNNLYSPVVPSLFNANSARSVAVTAVFSGYTVGNQLRLMNIGDADWTVLIDTSGHINAGWPSYDAGVPTNLVGSVTITPGILHKVTVKRIYGYQFQIWVDGVLDATVADIGGRTSYNMNTGRVLAGIYNYASPQAGYIHMQCVHLDNPNLDVRTLHSNPWQLFAQDLPQIPTFNIPVGKDQISVRKSMMLPTSAAAPASVGPVVLGVRAASAHAPQSGAFLLPLSSNELIFNAGAIAGYSPAFSTTPTVVSNSAGIGITGGAYSTPTRTFNNTTKGMTIILVAGNVSAGTYVCGNTPSTMYIVTFPTLGWIIVSFGGTSLTFHSTTAALQNSVQTFVISVKKPTSGSLVYSAMYIGGVVVDQPGPVSVSSMSNFVVDTIGTSGSSYSSMTAQINYFRIIDTELPEGVCKQLSVNPYLNYQAPLQAWGST